MPTTVIGVYLFWVMIAWNRVPAFSDKIEITGTESAVRDSVGIDISIKHPYFSLNSYSKDFVGFFTEYGESKIGVCCELNSGKKALKEGSAHDSLFASYLSYAKRLYPKCSMDSIEVVYVINTRKELFGKIDDRNAKTGIIRAIDEKGFCFTKRTPTYEDDKCVDSLWMLAGLNHGIAKTMRIGYDFDIRHSLTRLFRMEDISQFNYNLVLNEKNADIRSIVIDLGGPTDTKGICPVPDIVGPERIVYNTKEKIEEVRNARGIKMFCQNIEATNIQNIRLFLLTSISSLCIAYTIREIGVFILFLLRKAKRAWERIKANQIQKKKTTCSKVNANRKRRKKK
ncbi:hypothetical protein [Xylanibacter muris]|uniref:Uncharacterized protein n=2 Tax=Xylanibacter muris TaxID=2736290 RepID=A0ABX2APK2_9BACT|nr:hypothetical protein [Xylanibacter muris]NPD93171.1 hypothetical protein [Xylanibacter muris]